MLQGDPGTALVEPYTVVLTESAARKYVYRLQTDGRAQTGTMLLAK